MNVPEISSQETTEPVRTTEHDLHDLTSQSWNLELLVSGAALFATLSLPDLLDNALAYYRYNLMTDTDYIHEMIPAQVLGIIKGVSYLLFTAFLIHFIMRAFWVGLVGLLAVYPTGIDYDKIYNLSQYARNRFAQEMESLPNYITRLDRQCNVIFALTFSLVLLLLGVAGVYGILILFETLLELVLPNQIYETVHDVVRWVFLIGVFTIAMLSGLSNLPKLRDNPKLAPIAFRLTQAFSSRPLLYIMHTFYSHIPKQILQRRLALLFGIFFLTEIVFMSVELLQVQGKTDVLDGRSFITMRAPSHVADASSYDNLRSPDQLINEASIQADVIREPYLRLFLSYPKTLDVELKKRFHEPKWPTSLSQAEQRERKAAWYLNAFETYFSVYLNDSLYRSPGFLFTQRTDNGQRGLTAVLLTDKLKPGRNLLRVTAPDSGNKPKPYYQIPFWYVPEK